MCPMSQTRPLSRCQRRRCLKRRPPAIWETNAPMMRKSSSASWSRRKSPSMLGRLGHYEVMEVLGQGGFGVVLKVFDEKLRRVVAIKVLKPSLAVTSPPRKRFLREARAAAAVRHDSVVTIYAVEDTPTPYLVMEYVAGRSLQQKLDETGPLDLAGRA